MLRVKNKMREIFKRSKIQLSLFFTILQLLLFSGCDGFSFSDIDFNGDIRVQLDEDIGVTYSFYEYPDLTSQHIDKRLITGKTVSDSIFPEYVHEDTLLVGWQYLCNSDTGSTELPPYFSYNQKNYISSIRPGITDESLYAVWKKKCTITFVTNWPGVEIAPVILPEGDLLDWPQVEPQGRYRLWDWYTDPELTQYYNFSEPVTGDLTLYAHWVEVRNITYHKNDGSDETQQWEYRKDVDSEVAYCMFGERSGYGFLGWSDTASGGVTKWSGDTIRVTDDIHLYAVWTNQIVTITYVDIYGVFPNKTAHMGKGAHYSVGRVMSDQGNWYTDLGEVWVTAGKMVYGYDESSSVSLVNGYPNCTYNRWGWYDADPDPSNWQGSNYIVINNDKTFYVYWDDMIVEGGDVNTDFEFEESPDSDIPGLVSGPTSTSGGSVTFTATSGYSEYRWYFDGAYQPSSTSNTFTMSTSSLLPGDYTVMLVVKDGTEYYSWQGTLTKN